MLGDIQLKLGICSVFLNRLASASCRRSLKRAIYVYHSRVRVYWKKYNFFWHESVWKCWLGLHKKTRTQVSAITLALLTKEFCNRRLWLDNFLTPYNLNWSAFWQSLRRHLHCTRAPAAQQTNSSFDFPTVFMQSIYIGLYYYWHLTPVIVALASKYVALARLTFRS
jgi:hypothetical protein